MADPRPRPKLNIAGKFAHAFLHSRQTPLIILAASLFGLLAILLTPRTYNPDIVVPVANIIVERPGSNAQEMLNQVVRPLEALMASLSASIILMASRRTTTRWSRCGFRWARTRKGAW